MSAIRHTTADAAVYGTPEADAGTVAQGREALATGATALAAACALAALILFRLHGGGLWRDEVNSINFSTLPSVSDMWRHLDNESFPLLWMMIERAWVPVLGTSDAVLRTVGLVTALALIAGIWLCARWCGYTPAIAMALVAVNPTLLRTASLNRAYGLGILLAIVAYHAIWRMAQAPTRRRILWAGLFALLATQTLYYNIIFVTAMLLGACGVQWRRRDWKALIAFAGIEGICGLSLVPYALGPIRNERAWSFLIGHRMNNGEMVMTTRLSLNLPSLHHHLSASDVLVTVCVLSVWAGLIALCVWSLAAYTRLRLVSDQWRDGGDTARYASVTVLVSAICYAAFTRKVGYRVEPFHLSAITALAAVAMNHLFTALRPKPIFSRAMPVVTVLLLCVAFPRAVQAVVVRQSNADIVASVVNDRAHAGDLVLVHPYWLGQPFARYYHGRAPWVTAPSLEQYSYGGENYILKAMIHPTPDMDHLSAITATLKSGGSVWLVSGVGQFPGSPPVLTPLPTPYPADTRANMGHFLWQLMDRQAFVLAHHARERRQITLPSRQPVNPRENMEVSEISGWVN